MGLARHHGVDIARGEARPVFGVPSDQLRPYVQALKDEAEREAFVADYSARVAAVFRREADGSILFPFPRLFILARRR